MIRFFVILKNNTQDGCVILSVVNYAATCPMLGGINQFFRFALLRLSSHAPTIAAATSGTFNRFARAFSL